MSEAAMEALLMQKTVHLVHHFTKMDTRFVDREGRAAVQLVDHLLPAALEPAGSMYPTLRGMLEETSPATCLYYINVYGLEYIASAVWREGQYGGFLLVGPYLSGMPDSDWISDIIVRNQLPVSERKQLQAFYQSLMVVGSNETNRMGDLLVNLCGHPYRSAELLTPVVIQPVLSKEQQENHIAANLSIIEARYAHEKKLMDAIARGDKAGLRKLQAEMGSLFQLPDRIPESPIRSTKNLLITLNTLCRIAAERGGLHPVYLHHISEKFSITIERSANLPQLKKMSTVMLEEYCDAVSEKSTQGFSLVVKQAINHIDFHVAKPLSLQEIADEIHVNASHLSRKFKQETGMALTDYIQRQRVQASKLYLRRGGIPITEIAFMVGFNDVNYFTRVFKRCEGMTPTQYAKESR
ncbi:helix-turn-helix transcriptional regulator [Paenibacillus oryzisoli]|uniref:helix-turn-helix transcriptional regulator n=1 Tax=Paenibacillus oryzisoli TaxID=1850517 RepID=UPI003D28D1CA